MFKMESCSSVGGDCTCSYNVSLDKEYTVNEFIETVLKEKKNEWGYINIFFSDYYDRYKICEYKYGEIISIANEEYLNKKVIGVTASGGYSRMDYELLINRNGE